jgi:hypothetical protein
VELNVRANSLIRGDDDHRIACHGKRSVTNISLVPEARFTRCGLVEAHHGKLCLKRASYLIDLADVVGTEPPTSSQSLGNVIKCKEM